MVLNNVILSTPIVYIVLVIINLFIILHGHSMKFTENLSDIFKLSIPCIVREIAPTKCVFLLIPQRVGEANLMFVLIKYVHTVVIISGISCHMFSSYNTDRQRNMSYFCAVAKFYSKISKNNYTHLQSTV